MNAIKFIYFVCYGFLVSISIPHEIVFGEDSKPLNIAANLPLSGPLAVYGASVQEGVSMAMEETKESSSLVRFNFQDNEGQAKVAVSVANMQLLKKPDIYISGVKPQQMAIKDIILKSNIPHFEWIFDVNVRPKGERNNFRTWVNFKDEPRIFIDFAKELKPKKIAIIYVSLPHTDEEYNELIIPGLNTAGFNDIYVQPYQMDLTEFSTLVLNVRKYDPDLLIVSGFAENLAVMTRRLSEQGLVKSKAIISTYDLIDALPLVRPEWVEGIRVVSPMFLTRRDESKNIARFYKEFIARFHKEPNYTNAYAYDMAKIILEASKLRDTNTSLSEVIQNINIEGLTSRLKFDEFGSLPFSIERGVVKNGVLTKD